MNNKKYFLLLTFCFTVFISHAQILDAKKQGYYVPSQGFPKNVILVLAEGMGMSELSAATIKNNGTLNLFQFPVIGFMKPWAKDNVELSRKSMLEVLATGLTLVNYNTGLDANGKEIKTIMDVAKENKMATGIVTTGAITSDISAPFFLKKYVDRTPEQRAVDFLESKADILIGGGSDYFDKREDKKKLLQDYSDKGYEIVEKQRKIGKIFAPKALILVSPKELYGESARKDYLSKASVNATQMLNTSSPFGFFLLVANEHITIANNQADLNYTANEVLDLDKAMGELYKLYGKDPRTLIVVVGLPGKGNSTINKGNPMKGTLAGTHSGEEVSKDIIPIFASGPGADRFSGSLYIEEIFSKITTLIKAR